MLDILFKRRSVRRYAENQIDKDKLDRILQAGLLAPSSKSKYPFDFIVCDDADLNLKLSESKPMGASFLKHAPTSIVITGNQDESDVWIEDCSIAAGYMLLQAENEKLGACWIQIRERPHNDLMGAEQYVKNLLEIPDSHRVLAIIALGNKDAEKEARNESFLKREKIHFNKF
ncbi:nitroreductase family protein [Marinifilum sp. RC60d5]|uniref:nitroreductase family protein n=1 Tax=Marinifilum sp. RC60d5 TaxID=3458414 RepID=UPI0040373D0D